MLSRIVTLVFAVFLFTIVAHADTIVVTSGTVTLVPGPGKAQGIKTNPFVISGVNFSANIGGTDGLYGLKPCSPVPGLNPPCTSVSAGWSASGTSVFGNFTLNGTTYPTDVFNSLSLGFSVDTVVIPPELLGVSGLKIVAPFIFSGLAHPFGGPDTDLTGEGTVTIFMVRQTAGLFTGLFLDQAIFTFGPKPDGITIQETPEPATIVLLVSGLTGAGMWRRSRRRT